jgi:hypothetical protein
MFTVFCGVRLLKKRRYQGTTIDVGARRQQVAARGGELVPPGRIRMLFRISLSNM